MQTPQSLLRRTLAALLSFELAVGGVPARAWAEGLEDLASAEETVVEQVVEQDVPVEADEPAELVEPTPDVLPAEAADEVADPDDAATGEADSQAQQIQQVVDQQGQDAIGDQPVADVEADQATKLDKAPEALAAPEDATVSVSAAVVGVDSEGTRQVWVARKAYELPEGSTVEDLTKQMLDGSGLSYEGSTSQYGWSLDSITSADGRTLAFDPQTWDYWQLFVDGASSELGASSVTLADGMAVTWYYSGWGQSLPDEQSVTATCEVFGPDGTWSTHRELTMSEGSTAADLTEAALAAAGYTYASSTSQYGWSLDSITAPDGTVLAFDPQTWDYWQLFVDGTSSDVGASSVTLVDGMTVSWYYSGWGEDLPSAEIEVDPTAERPSYEAEWSGYKGTDLSGTVAADTPTEEAELLWSASLLPSGKQYANVSDPILVNGSVYIVADAVLHQLDAATGAEKAQAPLAGTVSYTSRIRYADGLVLVPLEGGRVQAITADKLVTVWLSDEVPELPGWAGSLAPQQNSSTIITHGGYAYLGTTDGLGSGGNLLCLSLETGATRWSHASGSGYYWAGCAMTDAGLVVADDGGTLSLIDALSGEVRATLALGVGSRASVVAADGSTVYVVTKDGVLRKVTVADGSLSEAANVKFASSSTTTPTIAGSRIVVAGVSESYTGVLGIVDPTTMQVVQTVTKAGDANIPGDIKSAPLVATTSDGIYAYFTANNLPGSIYVYKLGEALAAELFKPASDAQNYCMSSVIADANGVLYYTNDSATIFALKAVEKTDDKTDDGKTDDGKTDDGKTDDGKDGKTDDGKKDSGGSKKDDKQQDQGQKPNGSNANGGTRTAYIQVRSNTLGTAASSTPKRATESAAGTDRQTSANPKQEKDAADDAGATTEKADEDKVVEVEPYDGDLIEREPAPDDTEPVQKEEQAKGKLPIWPIVGMALGSVVLLLAVFGRRRDDGDEE